MTTRKTRALRELQNRYDVLCNDRDDLRTEVDSVRAVLGLDPAYKFHYGEFDQSNRLTNRVQVIESLSRDILPLGNRMLAVERTIRAEVEPHAEIEYHYEINEGEAPTDIEDDPLVGLYWRVWTMRPFPERPQYEVASGLTDTHANAWAAIEDAIIDHRYEVSLKRAFNNMSQTSGTVKW